MLATIQSGVFLNSLRFGYQAAESSSVTWQSSSPERFEQLHKMRKIFTAATGFLALVDYGQFLAILNHKWSIIDFLAKKRLFNLDTVVTVPILVGALFFCAVTIVVDQVAKRCQSKVDLNESLPRRSPNIEVRWDRPYRQRIEQYLIGCRIVANFALAFFAANPYFYLASAALQVYSLVTTLRWQWLRYDRVFDEPKSIALLEVGGPLITVPAYPEIQGIRLSYFRPLLPAERHKNSNCAVCFTEAPTVLSCQKHAVGLKCLIGFIYGEMERFEDLSCAMWDRHLHLDLSNPPTHHITYGELKKIEYSFKLAKEAFPRCPSCRDQPAYGEIEIYTRDRRLPHQETPATLAIVEPTRATV